MFTNGTYPPMWNVTNCTDLTAAANSTQPVLYTMAGVSSTVMFIWFMSTCFVWWAYTSHGGVPNHKDKSARYGVQMASFWIDKVFKEGGVFILLNVFVGLWGATAPREQLDVQPNGMGSFAFWMFLWTSVAYGVEWIVQVAVMLYVIFRGELPSGKAEPTRTAHAIYDEINYMGTGDEKPTVGKLASMGWWVRFLLATTGHLMIAFYLFFPASYAWAQMKVGVMQGDEQNASAAVWSVGAAAVIVGTMLFYSVTIVQWDTLYAWGSARPAFRAVGAMMGVAGSTTVGASDAMAGIKGDGETKRGPLATEWRKLHATAYPSNFEGVMQAGGVHAEPRHVFRESAWVRLDTERLLWTWPGFMMYWFMSEWLLLPFCAVMLGLYLQLFGYQEHAIVAWLITIGTPLALAMWTSTGYFYEYLKSAMLWFWGMALLLDAQGNVLCLDDPTHNEVGWILRLPPPVTVPYAHSFNDTILVLNFAAVIVAGLCLVFILPWNVAGLFTMWRVGHEVGVDGRRIMGRPSDDYGAGAAISMPF